MYTAIFFIHVAISIVAVLLGLLSLVVSLRGLVKKLKYRNIYRIIGRVYVASLYIQLVMGLTMYYYPGPDKAGIETSSINPGNSPYVRFWEIEHIAIMVFALFIVQIGCIFIGKTKDNLRKYRLTLFYFGLPLALMIFTMAMSMR